MSERHGHPETPGTSSHPETSSRPDTSSRPGRSAPWRQRRPWLMAEIGVNHDGSAARAADMIRASAAAGFDAVKFQYWIVEELLADHAPNAPYQGDGDQRALLERLRLDLDQLRALRAVAADAGVAFVVTPDGERACAEVCTLGPAALKIGSGDCDNPWLLDAVAAAGLPVVLSVGMADDAEIDRIVSRLDAVHELVVLHCISAYPTPLAEIALHRLGALGRFGRPVGLSDHTVGVAAPAAALALGAAVVEKHVTWSTAADGPDHAASLALADAAAWVRELRDLAAGLAPSHSAEQDRNRPLVRKGLYARRDLAAGHVLEAADLQPLRPLLDGIGALDRELVVGRALRHAIPNGTALRWSDIQPVGRAA